MYVQRIGWIMPASIFLLVRQGKARDPKLKWHPFHHVQTVNDATAVIAIKRGCS